MCVSLLRATHTGKTIEIASAKIIGVICCQIVTCLTSKFHIYSTYSILYIFEKVLCTH